MFIQKEEIEDMTDMSAMRTVDDVCVAKGLQACLAFSRCMSGSMPRVAFDCRHGGRAVAAGQMWQSLREKAR